MLAEETAAVLALGVMTNGLNFVIDSPAFIVKSESRVCIALSWDLLV
jgi:hypothetical protein